MATQYKQPSSLNGVSVALVLLLAAAVWVGLSAWPVLAINSNVKNEIEDALPRLYRANLFPEPNSTAEATTIHDELVEKLKALGVDDPDFQVAIARDDKLVSIEVRYRARLQMKGLRKTYVLAMRPRVQTGAARVEW